MLGSADHSKYIHTKEEGDKGDRDIVEGDFNI